MEPWHSSLWLTHLAWSFFTKPEYDVTCALIYMIITANTILMSGLLPLWCRNRHLSMLIQYMKCHSIPLNQSTTNVVPENYDLYCFERGILIRAKRQRGIDFQHTLSISYTLKCICCFSSGMTDDHIINVKAKCIKHIMLIIKIMVDVIKIAGNMDKEGQIEVSHSWVDVQCPVRLCAAEVQWRERGWKETDGRFSSGFACLQWFSF